MVLPVFGFGADRTECRVAQASPRSWLFRWLRGESFIAATGLALAAVVVGVVCVSAWWGMHAQQEAAERGRVAQVRSVVAVLAGAAESALAREQYVDLRSQIVAAGVGSGLTSCRVRLADGTVIASASADGPLVKPPASWPAWPAGGEPQNLMTEQFGAIKIAGPVRVEGRGVAVIEAEAPLPTPIFGQGTAEPGIAAAGVVGLACLWWVYRRLRVRLRVLGAIRESLVAAAEGEVSSAALAVAPEFGLEAKGWNALLVSRDLSMIGVSEQLVTDRRRSDGDNGDSAHQALDCLWLGVLLLDADMNVVYANGASAVLLRSRREDLTGKGVIELFPEDAAKGALAGVSGGTVKHRVQWEVERKAESGATGVVRVSVKPARKGDSFTAFALLEDVSQQRVADKSRNGLIAQASHELRTPLTNIRLYVEALLEDDGNDPTIRATAINVINQESRRLERIVADMLSVSEIEAGSFRMRRDDVPIASILDDIKHDFAPQAQDKEITLTFDLAPKLPPMTGDRDKITLALHNLVGNAIKYTPAGGKVTVKAASENPGTPGEILIIDVIDTGIGIKPEEHEAVFDRFFRSADKRIASITGTGLGLTLSREVARLHGGDVVLKSKLNEGSTFSFRIPAASDPSQVAKQAA